MTKEMIMAASKKFAQKKCPKYLTVLYIRDELYHSSRMYGGGDGRSTSEGKPS